MKSTEQQQGKKRGRHYKPRTAGPPKGRSAAGAVMIAKFEGWEFYEVPPPPHDLIGDWHSIRAVSRVKAQYPRASLLWSVYEKRFSWRAPPATSPFDFFKQQQPEAAKFLYNFLLGRAASDYLPPLRQPAFSLDQPKAQEATTLNQNQ